jgi:hypothetical protein
MITDGASNTCELTADGEARWCPAMERYLPPAPNARVKGLVVVQTVNLDEFNDGEFQQRVLGVAYKRGAQDKGVMLNSCPWCGESLRARINALSVPAEEKTKQCRNGSR